MIVETPFNNHGSSAWENRRSSNPGDPESQKPQGIIQVLHRSSPSTSDICLKVCTLNTCDKNKECSPLFRRFAPSEGCYTRFNKPCGTSHGRYVQCEWQQETTKWRSATNCLKASQALKKHRGSDAHQAGTSERRRCSHVTSNTYFVVRTSRMNWLDIEQSELDNMKGQVKSLERRLRDAKENHVIKREISPIDAWSSHGEVIDLTWTFATISCHPLDSSCDYIIMCWCVGDGYVFGTLECIVGCLTGYWIENWCLVYDMYTLFIVAIILVVKTYQTMTIITCDCEWTLTLQVHCNKTLVHLCINEVDDILSLGSYSRKVLLSCISLQWCNLLWSMVIAVERRPSV